MTVTIYHRDGSVLFTSETATTTAEAVNEIVQESRKRGGAPILSRADLSYANLSNADLTYASLSGAILSGTDLSRADLSYANLSGASQGALL